MQIYRSFLLLLLALWSMGSNPAAAGAISIAPTMVEVEAGRQFCSLTIGNDGAAPATVQIRGFDWQRDDDGTDQLSPAASIAFNPSIATLAAGEHRLIRCSLPSPPTGQQANVEQQWRFLIDELPAPVTAGQAAGIQTLLRLSIPVFRRPAGLVPKLVWSQFMLANGQPALRLTNTGLRHVKVLGLALQGSDGSQQRVERSFYLLQAGTITLPLPTVSPKTIVKITATTTNGPLTASLDPRLPTPPRPKD